MKKQRDVFPAWSAGRRSSTPKTGQAARARHLTLTLAEDEPFKERGYNPYETVVHVRNTRDRDVWRNKPKRS